MMHTELNFALNFIISHLYNKLPRRRVDVFREELENGFQHRFQGHWYPEEPSKGSGFRCVKLAGDKVDPVVDAAARASGLDIAEIKSYLPGGLTLWIDPGEVSYRVGEHGHLQVLYRRPASSVGSAVSAVDGSGSSSSSSSIVVDPNTGCGSSSPSSGAEVDHQLFRASSSSAAVGCWASPAAAVGCFDVQSTGAASGASSSGGLRGFGAGIRPSDLSPVGSGVWPSSVSPATCGSGGSSPHQPQVSTATFTAATFAQTKFGSTKMKTHGPARPSKLSPTSAVVAGGPDCGMTRISPTGTPVGLAAGRWNLSPTAAAAGCLPQLPIGAAAGRLSPMQQATNAAGAGAASAYVHQLQAAAAAAASGVDPRIDGLHDWLLLQQRAQRRELQQQQQLQSYLMVAAAQQQQQQHQQQVRAAAAIMAASAFGTSTTPASSPPLIGGHALTSSSSAPSFNYQGSQQQQYHLQMQQQQQQQQHFQRQIQASGKTPSLSGYHDIMLMSSGTESNAAASGAAMDTMKSHAASLMRDDMPSSSLGLTQIDWSFDVGSTVPEVSGSSESQAPAGGYSAAQGLQHLLLAN